jgi:hypothetical protein
MFFFYPTLFSVQNFFKKLVVSPSEIKINFIFQLF